MFFCFVLCTIFSCARGWTTTVYWRGVQSVAGGLESFFCKTLLIRIPHWNPSETRPITCCFFLLLASVFWSKYGFVLLIIMSVQYITNRISLFLLKFNIPSRVGNNCCSECSNAPLRVSKISVLSTDKAYPNYFDVFLLSNTLKEQMVLNWLSHTWTPATRLSPLNYLK